MYSLIIIFNYKLCIQSRYSLLYSLHVYWVLFEMDFLCLKVVPHTRISNGPSPLNAKFSISQNFLQHKTLILLPSVKLTMLLWASNSLHIFLWTVRPIPLNILPHTNVFPFIILTFTILYILRYLNPFPFKRPIYQSLQPRNWRNLP